MRKSFLLTFSITFLIMVQSGFCQIQFRIDKVFGGPYRDQANAISFNHAGEYIIAGQSESEDYSNDAWVLKLNSNGDTLWSKKFGDPYRKDYFESVISLKHGGYVLTGVNSSINTNNQAEGWILFLNENGETLRSKLYGDQYVDNISSIIQLNDGSLLAIGTYENQGTSSNKLWIMKSDSVGNTLWTKVYDGSPSCKASKIIQIDDQSLLVLAYKTKTPSNYIGQKWVLKMNLQGDTLWTRTFSESFNDVSTLAATVLKNGNIALVGDTCNEQTDKTDVWFGLIGSNGTVLKDSLLKTCGGYDFLNSTQALPNGGFISAGSTECGQLREDNALIIVQDASGDTLWSKIFGSSGIDEIRQIISTDDSTFIFTGKKNDDFWFGSFIYKDITSSIHSPLKLLSQNTTNGKTNKTCSLIGKLNPLVKGKNSSIVVSENKKTILLRKKY